MIKYLLVAVLSVVFIGCNESIEGELSVVRPMVLKFEKRQPTPGECEVDPTDCYGDDYLYKTVPVGDYNVKMKFVKKEKVSFNWGEGDFLLNLPRGSKIPKENGSFHFKGSEMGQNYDLIGEVKTEYSRSETKSGVERCSYYRDEHICFPTGDGSHQCRWERRHFWGQRKVVYHLLYTDKSISMDFIGADNSLSAQYSAEKQWSDVVYEREGTCF